MDKKFKLLINKTEKKIKKKLIINIIYDFNYVLFHIMIAPLLRRFELTVLCGIIIAPLINISSLISTSSPKTDNPSILTHFPMWLSQPTILSVIKEFDLIDVFCKTTVFCNLTP